MTQDTDLLDGNNLMTEDESLKIHLYAERAYLSYAMSVVKARSLPQVQDGLKPVQRRILFSMREMGLTSSGKHVKSARVVGDVIGKLHPHGDSSVYDAMVRVAQDFTLRYPLVDGQGNFGSRDGDGAAAMRYTEVRLTPIAELLLSEIDKGTVDFKPNYDGAFQEPELMPARLPFVLLNGAKGPAVGYRPEIPSHNLREVANLACLLIKNRDASWDEIMGCVGGPDFPGGGQIISSHQSIRDAYESGRGSIRMRARWRREELARGQWRIIVNELPHETSVAKILSEIEAATNPQPKAGKKELSQDQKNVKALIAGVLDSARDESCKAEPVRLVLEPKTSKISEDEMMAALLAHTTLESSVPINFVMIGLDGNPNTKNLRQILLEWIDFRHVTVERRIRHRLNEVNRRLHILEGRMLAFLRIEEVIRIIRESDDPKAALMEQIGLSEVQAEDILEIRLRQLARLEGIRIEKEAAELRDEREKLQHLLDNPAALTKTVVDEIQSDAKKYGDDRRTLIEPVDSVRVAEVSVPDEPVTVILSANGWVRSRQGHGVDRSTLTYKQGDSEFIVVETRTVWPLIIVDNNGRVYSIKVSDIPGGRGDGVPITTMIDFQDGGKMAQAFSDDPRASYLFSNSGSYGFITQVQELVVTRGKAGKAFMTLENGEKVLPPVKISDLNGWLAAISYGDKESRMVMFPAHEMKVMPKGRGVIIMGLETGEELLLIKQVSPDQVSIHLDGNKVVLDGENLARFRLHRARKGCQLGKKIRPDNVS